VCAILQFMWHYILVSASGRLPFILLHVSDC